MTYLYFGGDGGKIVQARVGRSRPKRNAEDSAKAVGEGMPYLEYALHMELLNKMRLRGANALFDMVVQISIGDFLTIAIATGTAVQLAALPIPPSVNKKKERGGLIGQMHDSNTETVIVPLKGGTRSK